jgi:arylsulfatase A-like enzyme
MAKSISKREFLKLLAFLPPSMILSQPFFQKPDRLMQNLAAKNVLLIVFDALSAQNISLYGYPRQTMPNLSRIAQKGTVYHNHYAGGNWTVPGTGSLLTGTYPWTHRAFSDELGGVEKGRESHNLFHFFDQYYRLGYSHNPNVYIFFNQFWKDIEQVKNQADLFVKNNLSLDRLFPLDNDIAPITWDRMMEEGEKGYTYSLFFAPLYQAYGRKIIRELQDDFPRGVPSQGEDDYFLLEDGIDWLISDLTTLQRPFLGYFHFLPPHQPYHTRHEFINQFKNDGIGSYVDKPRHPVFGGPSGKPLNLAQQGEQRQLYDEFILYADFELGRLYDALEQSGILENTWLIFTSDHGEMFERGFFGHRIPVLYQPVIRIPLVIVEPGQKVRRDMFTSSSAVDVLPTLLKVTEQPIPDWLEGSVLEPYNDTLSKSDRRLYAVEARKSGVQAPLGPASIMMVKDRYKLTYYFGYKQLETTGPLFELYDIEKDPEELVNIYDPVSQVSRELATELLEKLNEVNKPYSKS